MRKVRVAAAMLAVLTALIDAFLCLSPDSGPGVLLLTAAAAICLAVVVPFDALVPAARKRMVGACFGFVVLIAGAFWRARHTYVDPAPIAALLGLLAIGLALSVWAFAVRNRRRRPGWSSYYDL